MQLFPNNLRSFLKGMERVERVLCRFVRGVLLLAMLAIAGGTAWLLINPPWAGHQGESFYLTVIAALAFGRCLKHYLDAGARMDRATVFHHDDDQPPEDSGADDAVFDDSSQFSTDEQFRILERVLGGPTDRILGISVTANLRTVIPSDDQLDELADEIDAGATLEEAIEVVLPHAVGWKGIKRKMFLSLVKGLLEQHQVTHAAAADEFAE